MINYSYDEYILYNNVTNVDKNVNNSVITIYRVLIIMRLKEQEPSVSHR